MAGWLSVTASPCLLDFHRESTFQSQSWIFLLDVFPSTAFLKEFPAAYLHALLFLTGLASFSLGAFVRCHRLVGSLVMIHLTFCSYTLGWVTVVQS